MNEYLFGLSRLNLQPSPFLTFTKCLSSILFSFQFLGIHLLRVSLISVFHHVPRWWIILIVDLIVDKTEWVKKLFGGVRPNLTDTSAQDNKSSECIFNSESMYSIAWRLTCFFAQICYLNAACLKWQHVSIHLFMAHWLSVSYSEKEMKQPMAMKNTGLPS